jgi:hypothetical protein
MTRPQPSGKPKGLQSLSPGAFHEMKTDSRFKIYQQKSLRDGGFPARQFYGIHYFFLGAALSFSALNWVSMEVDMVAIMSLATAA